MVVFERYYEPTDDALIVRAKDGMIFKFGVGLLEDVAGRRVSLSEQIGAFELYRSTFYELAEYAASHARPSVNELLLL